MLLKEKRYEPLRELLCSELIGITDTDWISQLKYTVTVLFRLMFLYVNIYFLYNLSINFLFFIFSFMAYLDPSLLPSQLRCLYPRCCHVNSCPTRTSVPL